MQWANSSDRYFSRSCIILNLALCLLKEKVFNGATLPEIKNMIENVDVSTLDAGHVLPNMSPPNIRGVWFPLGYN